MAAGEALNADCQRERAKPRGLRKSDRSARERAFYPTPGPNLETLNIAIANSNSGYGCRSTDGVPSPSAALKPLPPERTNRCGDTRYPSASVRRGRSRVYQSESRGRECC